MPTYLFNNYLFSLNILNLPVKDELFSLSPKTTLKPQQRDFVMRGTNPQRQEELEKTLTKFWKSAMDRGVVTDLLEPRKLKVEPVEGSIRGA